MTMLCMMSSHDHVVHDYDTYIMLYFACATDQDEDSDSMDPDYVASDEDSDEDYDVNYDDDS